MNNGFAEDNLRASMLIASLREEKKDYFIVLTKIAGIIQELVDKSLHPLLHDNSAAMIWKILLERFQHISLLSINQILVDACDVKYSNYKDVTNYTNWYKITFDKLLSLCTSRLTSHF